MPLYDNAIDTIRTNLEQLQNGERPRFQAIGKLTDEQLETINQKQIEKGFPIRHHYESRVIRDGYQIDDLIKQIESSLAESSVIENNKVLKSTVLRDDGYGNMVEDWAVFEMTAKRPKMELFSVIPKGDNNKPPK